MENHRLLFLLGFGVCALLFFNIQIHSMIPDLSMAVTATLTDAALLCHQVAECTDGDHRAHCGKDLLQQRGRTANAKMLHHLRVSFLASPLDAVVVCALY